MIPLALFAIAGCIAIGSGSDHIVAGDFVSAAPEFGRLPSDHPVALAPAPGVQRVFREAELRRLALKLNLAPAEAEVCFERPLAPLDAARMLAVMQRQLPNARVEIVEHSRFRAPEGEMEFPLAGLRQTATGGLWTGAIRYARGRRFAIWAKVKVLETAARVIAVEPLKAGRAIEPSQVRIEMREAFPLAGLYAASIEEIAGQLLLRPVNAGTAISTRWIAAPKDVVRGETVRVEVRTGAAVLQFEGKAETSGSAGERITVLNADSKKRFPALVEGKGRASVVADRGAPAPKTPPPAIRVPSGATPRDSLSPAAPTKGTL